MMADWKKYEIEKVKLKNLLLTGKLTHADYERAIRRLVKKLKI